MIRDITIGQYYQTESVIHRMDPRFKIIATMVFIISIFIFTNPYIYIVASFFLGICIALSRVPFKFMVRGLKSVVMLILLTVIFNMFFIQGEPLFHIWKITISKEGVETAAYMAVRLIILIIGSSIMTLTTTPNQLTDGLESVMKPLKLFRVPVHEIAMMMSIALRFIPILMEETDKIIKAQTARGASFEDKNMIKRVKSLVPVLVPLFVSAFRRASDLAMAMEARCYRGGDGRTKMKPLKYHRVDFVGYVVIIIYFACIIFTGIYAHYLPFGEGL